MRISVAALRALVLASTPLLAGGAQGQSPSPAGPAKPAPRPVAPVATTFDAIHDGKHAAGKAVEFPVMLLPETAIRNKSGGKTTYYVLAVRKDGPYMKAVEAALAEVKGPGGEMLREMPTVLGDDKRYRQLIGGLDELLKRAFDVALAPEETVAVEVPGLEAVASAYDWETVVDPKASLSWLTPRDPIKPFGSEYALSIDATAVRRDLINLSSARPPKLDQSLPQMKLSPLFKFTNQPDLDNFNAAVDLFNAELLRRRGYITERTQADVQLALDRLDFRLGQTEETLAATVIAPPPFARETFSRIYKGKTPAAFVRERGKPQSSILRRAIAATAVQICSYPTGASVRLDGRDAGVTPLVLRSLPAASKLSIVVAKAGVPPQEAVETVPMKPSGVKRFEYNLVTTQPRLLGADEAKRLFDPAFKPGQPFSLAITSPAATPLPREKKETKEQKKQRELRDREVRRLADYVGAMRKAATDPSGALASWFRLVDASDADVSVEIGAIQPSERRSKYDSISTHRVTVRLADDPPGAGSLEDIAPSIAKPVAPLESALGRLKNERWQRALGVE